MRDQSELVAVLIENRIFTCRGAQVMLDYHLAELYQVKTKRLNEQVKRNLKRFPESFMFQLSESEWENLQSQIATAKRRALPYVFTEQGVAMLASVLRSEIAVNVSIAIMTAFVEMRKSIGNHQQLLKLSDDFVAHKLKTNQNFEQIFKALEAPELKNNQGVFFDGQTYDAYDFVNKLIKKANQSIVVIDNYIDDSVITQLTKKAKFVKVFLLSRTFGEKIRLDIAKANSQYPTFKAIAFSKAHDRFLILDETDVYHIGASLKDLGKKWFAFSKLNSDSVTVINQIKGML